MKKPITKSDVASDFLKISKNKKLVKQLHDLEKQGMTHSDVMAILIEEKLNQVIERVNELYDNKK